MKQRHNAAFERPASQDGLATRPGNALARASRLAAITPRSEIRPVTSREGVTSKGELVAPVTEGASWTVAMRPLAPRPAIWVTASADRVSIGTSAMPSKIEKSMDDEGAAA